MNFLKNIKNKLSELSTVDKTLMFIFSLCMVFLVYSLFFQTSESYDLGKINSVFRTSASAIFGYILSGNFSQEKRVVNVKENKKQIVCTAGIGIFCMVSLIAMGLFMDITSISTDDISTITMVRDFVSSSVGFLIGSPKSED